MKPRRLVLEGTEEEPAREVFTFCVPEDEDPGCLCGVEFHAKDRVVVFAKQVFGQGP